VRCSTPACAGARRTHAAALARFHEVLLVAPTLPEAHVNAGFALLGLGRHRAARDAFVGAIELREMQANAYWGLAVALEALGDIAGARGAMRTFVHLAPPGVEQVRRARAALWEWEREPRFPRARDGSSAAPISVSSQRAAVAP
jgi:Flp pilus assembly protein TadD